MEFNAFFQLTGFPIFIAVAIVLSSLLFSLVRSAKIGISLEAVIGVIYAIAAALTLFIAGIAPGGHVHVEHILSGSILWIAPVNIMEMLIGFSLTGSLLYLFRKPFFLLSDSKNSDVPARSIIRWDFAFYLLTGIVIALSVKQCGVVLVFAFLIIPATASACYSSSWLIRYAVACGIGCFSSVVGLTCAHRFDFSAGPSVAFVMGIIILLSGIYSAFKKVRSTKQRSGLS